ncbi:MAG: ParB N-terminal domain-containing protein, partial [Lachnospiraceae bacterium]|nr:ParB N-terminal domain-containing protein [Lachnospiraceae bacterium]
MKANAPKRKVFQDAVDLISPPEDMINPVNNGQTMIYVKKVVPFHNHPFRLYEGKRLDDMVESIKEHGVLIPVIVQKIADGYEMLSGHNRWNAAKIAGIKEIPAIIKENLTEREAYVYVIETNMLQRSFDDLLPSEKAA